MDPTVLAILATIAAALALRARDQRRRIGLLAELLRPYRIEKLMETLADGYLRALGEPDPARSGQIWALMDSSETALCEQLRRFSADLGRPEVPPLPVGRLAWGLPLADRLLPCRTFDLRDAIAIHTRGITAVADNLGQLGSKEKAYMLCAEMFLLQHTCHWYCRSKAVASGRLLARHRTAYAQVLAAVSRETRESYLALIAG